MSSHYHSENPTTTGKTAIVKTYQLGYQLSFKSQSGIFGWRKVDKGSELLLHNLEVPEEGKVLDMGCGYGFLGIALAKAYPKLDLYLTDINQLAVKYAKENCKLNHVHRNTTVLQGNLYESLTSEKFESIVTNPPLMAGKDVLWAIVSKAKDYLVDKGTLQLVVPKKKGLKSMQDMLTKSFGSWDILAKGSGFWAIQSHK